LKIPSSVKVVLATLAESISDICALTDTPSTQVHGQLDKKGQNMAILEIGMQ